MLNDQGKLVKISADIYQYPPSTEIASHPQDSVVTLGDLHGNAAKFLHLLVREGILDIPEDKYNQLIDTYKTDFYNSGLFFELLADIKKCDPCPTIRLVGDDVADRGNNDNLMLIIYYALKNLDIKVEVLASNHGIEFLKQFAYGIDTEYSKLKLIYVDEHHAYGNSFHGMVEDLKTNDSNIGDLEKTIEYCYLPNISLLSYHKIGENELNIFSHAPINMSKIRNLSILFQVSFAADTIESLTATIDSINQEFKKYSTSKEGLTTFFDVLSSHGRLFNILNSFVNDRYKDIVDDNTPINYKIHNIHGHVGESSIMQNQIDNWDYTNLDTHLGQEEGLNHRSYLAYITHEPPSVALSLPLDDKQNHTDPSENKVDSDISPLINKISEELKAYVMEHTDSIANDEDGIYTLIYEIIQIRNEPTMGSDDKISALASLLENELLTQKIEYSQQINPSLFGKITHGLSFKEAMRNSEFSYANIVTSLLKLVYTDYAELLTETKLTANRKICLELTQNDPTTKENTSSLKNT